MKAYLVPPLETVSTAKSSRRIRRSLLSRRRDSGGAATTSTHRARTIGDLALPPTDAEPASRHRGGRPSDGDATLDVAEALPALIWRGDARGRIRYANERLLAALTVTRDDVLGTGWQRFVHPDDLQATHTVRQEAMQTGRALSVRLRFRHGDGRYRRLLCKAEAIRDVSGRVRSWWGILVDANVHDDTRASYPASESPSRESSVPASEIAAAILHEVNQPLAAVLLNARASQRWLSAAPADLERARSALDRAVRDGAEVIDVMTRTRALYRRTAFERTAIDLRHTVEQAAMMLGPECRSRGIELQFCADPELPSVLADPVQMRQVVLNLSRNAIEALDPLAGDAIKRISYACMADGEHVRVEVADSGPGLQDAALVFDPFFTSKATGMGMGLTLCRLIVEAHHGRLVGANNSTGGATFSFTIPSHRDPKR